MVLEWLAKPIVWAALASFFAGSFAYVLARLVIRPLIGYQMLKQRVRKALETTTDGRQGRPGALRAHAAALTDCYNDRLPGWYRLVLRNRGEEPLEAARHLMALANMRPGEPAAARAKSVRRTLRMAAAGGQR